MSNGTGVSRRTVIWHGLAGLLAGSGGALAQSYPTKVVTAVHAYPPGAGGDFVARTVTGRMQKSLGQNIIVENISGAGGSLAVQKVLNAPADGYTILMGTLGELVQTPLALTAARYRSEDLRIVGRAADSHLLLLARPDLPANNVNELVALAKSRSDRPLTFGHLGRGTAWHLAGERLMRDTGIKLLAVPYRGATQLFPDLISGQVDIAFLALGGPTLGMIQKGQLKAIAFASEGRQSSLPSVPTFDESGLVKDFRFNFWQACMVARATPEPVVQRLHQALNEVMGDPQVRKAIEDSGLLPAEPASLQDAGNFFAAEVARYRAIATSINLQPE